ncbi:MAG: DUF938 domain-containing protein [Woeseiaceae bacterium]|nr:DUF938 domain-containing protein [Woeseiaceae bacterium]
MMPGMPFAAAAERNASPILGVIEHELRDATSILEIGTGTAQQAVTFARHLPLCIWQTSDLDENHEGIRARIEDSGLDNVRPPLSLDVRSATPESARYDAVYSANTAHIMSAGAVDKMFAYVGETLGEGGLFLLYGPFRVHGKFTTQSNAAFDQSLRRQNPAMGIRDLETLDDLAAAARMYRKRCFAMPSNNFLAVWQRFRRTA